MELMVAGTEGALKHNIPDFVKIALQHKAEREKWWNENTNDENTEVLQYCGGLHAYFVRLLRTIKPLKTLPRRILSIINTNRHVITNRILRKHLRRLGYKHSEWDADRMVVNGNQQQDIDEHMANYDGNVDDDSGDSNDDDMTDNSDDSDGERYESDGDNMDDEETGLGNIELITKTSRKNRMQLLKLQRRQSRRNNR